MGAALQTLLRKQFVNPDVLTDAELVYYILLSGFQNKISWCDQTVSKEAGNVFVSYTEEADQ